MAFDPSVVVTKPTIAALRLNVAPTSTIQISNYATPGDSGGGVFSLDSADTTSPDNGGTIIVDAAGNRYYRECGDAINVRWFGAAGDGATNDTSALLAAIAAVPTSGGAVYLPAGTYSLGGSLNLTGTIALRGDGIGISVLMWGSAGGLIYTGGAIVSDYNVPTLALSDLSLVTTQAGGSTALRMTYTGGSGYSSLGPHLTNVLIAGSATGKYWDKGVYGTNVRNSHLDRVTVQGSAIATGTAYGMQFDGDGDPVELWLDHCYFEAVVQAVEVTGTYEGVYLRGCNFTSVLNGVRYVPVSPQPVIIISNCYLNGQRKIIELDQVAYFVISSNVISSCGLATGSFYGVYLSHSSGIVNAGDIANNTFLGGNSYTGSDHEYGVYSFGSNVIDVHDNTFYDNYVAVTALTGTLGLRCHSNQYVACTTQEAIPAAYRWGASRPETAFSATMNGVNQGVTAGVFTKLSFSALPFDYSGYFDAVNNRWIPPGGTYRLNASAVATTNVQSGKEFVVSIYKNGSEYKRGAFSSSETGVVGGCVSCLAESTGSDYFEVFVYVDSSSTPVNILGNPTHTYFMGEMVQ